MTTIITMEGSNASYPPLKVESNNTGVTIPLSPRAKGRSTWLSKALREDGSKPTRGSRETAGKLAMLIPETVPSWERIGQYMVIPRPVVFVSYAGIVCFRWEVAPNAWLDVECKAGDKMCYSGKSDWGQVSGTERLRDTLPEVIRLWLRRIYG